MVSPELRPTGRPCTVATTASASLVDATRVWLGSLCDYLADPDQDWLRRALHLYYCPNVHCQQGSPQ